VAVAIKDVAAAWTGTTAGTSPAVSSGDHTAFIEDLDDAEWDNFLARHQIIPQAFLVVDSSSTNQGSWRDWAVTKRAEGYPVSITAGCAWGDTVIDAGNDTAPEFRSAALNSQDVMLCAGGLDRLAAYLSFAPAVFGRRIEGGIGHNLTNDDLVYSEVEKRWDERVSGHLTKLHKFGVVTYRMRGSRPYRYVISQGLSTLQNNSAAWNEGSDDTCLVMQRDLADYIDRVLKEDLDGKQLGADKVTPATISAVIFRKAQVLKERRGLITDFTINSVTLDASGNGYNVEWAVKLPTTTDFITCTTQILVGE